jgi:hypothetical protein
MEQRRWAWGWQGHQYPVRMNTAARPCTCFSAIDLTTGEQRYDGYGRRASECSDVADTVAEPSHVLVVLKSSGGNAGASRRNLADGPDEGRTADGKARA